MPTEAKRGDVAELREEIANARTMIVSEYRGLTVKEIAEIRRALRKQDVTYHVVKNRLMRIAAEDAVGEALSPLLVGPTAIAFGTDEAGTAKAVLDATRPYNDREDHGRCPGRRAIDADGVTRSRPAVARGAPGQARRRRCRRRSGPWRGCSPHRCATSAMPSRRSPSRRAQPPSACPYTDQPHRPRPTKENTHGHPDPGPAARSDRQDDRARAVRVHQALRGALRRDRRRSGRRRRPARPPVAVPPLPAPPPRSRPSSPRSSPRSARTRSRSSRSFAS